MVVEKAYGKYTNFRIPGIVATNQGSLLRYCECREAVSDWAVIDLKIARSEDAGKTWETVLLIESGGNTLNNPVMFVDGERLVLLYCVNYKEIWQHISIDDGKSFGDAERVDFENSVHFFYNVVAVGPGHGVAHNGNLIVPIWFAYNKTDEKAHNPSLISTLYSEDHGKSWKIGEIIFPDKLKNPSECALAVTAEGEILISIRHEGEKRMRALAKSLTGFSGWNDFHFEKNLPDPVCMGSMTHKNGVIYHSNCAIETKRRNLSIKVSTDCFKTYRNIWISEVGGYSDIALLGNKIYILYEKTFYAEKQGQPCVPFELFLDIIDLQK